MRTAPRIVIIGAGPTGIGAAWRLQELGHADWLLLEGAPHAGGLASSAVDSRGFTWDHGGHVLFSHYRYFDALMVAALGADWLEHEREAWVWMRDRWIPYPFQNNIWCLPEADLIPCIDGLLEVFRHSANGGQASRPATFADWLLNAFGPGLCDVFMFPYNRKVWGYEPASLDVGWMGERVATVDVRRIVRNIVQRRNDVGWGPNATFRYPLRGGTGAIWRSLFAQLDAQRCRLGCRVAGIDPGRRTLRLADGAEVEYDFLISTQPLDRLLDMVVDREDLRALRHEFVHGSSHIVGVGLDGQPPAGLQTKCWLYFPEPETPFYRVTVFSNYSPHNVSRPGEQWSLMCEVTETPAKPVDHERIVDQVIDGLKHARMIDGDARIASTWQTRLEYGYPTPWLGRDAVLEPIQSELAACGVLSRGRFGAWKYEVSNQDHSVMQGVEAVDHILLGVAETTVRGIMGTEPPDAAEASGSLNRAFARSAQPGRGTGP